jgi:DMSO/TMAO reductase YedYZ molybdopterin-dependent catalytic subunit
MTKESSIKAYPAPLVGALLGGLTSLPVIALLFLGSQIADLPFVPFDVFDFLARILPGNLITLAIDTMVRTIQALGLGRISGTAKSIEQGTGIVLMIGAGVVLGLVTTLLVGRTRWPGRMVGAALGALAFLMATGIEFMLGNAIAGHVLSSLVWLAILFVAWGALLGGWLVAPELAPAEASPERGTQPSELGQPATSRRAFLFELAGGSIGLAVLVVGLGRLFEAQQANGAGQALSNLTNGTPSPAPSPNSSATPGPTTAAPSLASTPTLPATETAQATMRDRVPPAPGTRPELTSNQNFYRIDIDTLPPVLDKSSWQLKVSGLFDRPRTLTLPDLLAYPAVTQPITLSCISNPVAGDLISTSNWVGVRLRDVLKDLSLRPEAQALDIRAADGFYESVAMQDLMDPRTLLVYGMNGETLPTAHGYPLRIYIPNRYGMKQPKWITSIEASDQLVPGYWVDRGWSATAYPQIVSVIDTVAKDHVENGRVPIGGIAWAGDRGIRKVELQVDGGEWMEATLRTPPLGPLTWVEWRLDWPPVKGTHTFRVRATDGTGALQIEQSRDSYPDGATGYHTVTATIV